MVKAFVSLGMIAASLAIIVGCTPSERSGSTGASLSLPNAQRTQVGVVIALREISLNEDRAPLVGRADTQGRTISQVGGGVLSAMTDESTDDHVHEVDAQEITVRIDSGAIVVVTQPNVANLQLSQRVKVINTQQYTRVLAF